jgi:predicted MFS family arabinose efflux permease
MIIRRWSIKRLLVWSTPLAIVSFYAQVATGSYGLILGAGLVSGLATVFFQVAAAPFFMRHSEARERPYLFSMNFAAGLAASILGSFLGGYLPGCIERGGLIPHQAYRTTLYVFGGLVLAALLPYLLLREARPSDPAWDRFRLRSNRGLIMKIFTPNLVTGLGAGLSVPFINLYFQNALHASTRSIGVYYSIGQALMITGVLVAPVIAGRIGKIRTVVYSQLLSIPFLVVMGLTRSAALAVPAFLIRAALMNMAQPLFTNYAMERIPREEQALVNALLVIAWTAGWGLSASIGGLLIERFSYAVPFLTTSAIYLVSSVLMHLFFARDPGPGTPVRAGTTPLP